MTEKDLNEVYCGKFNWGNGEKTIQDMLAYILGTNTYNNLDDEIKEDLYSHFNNYISKLNGAHAKDVIYLAMQGTRLTEIGNKISVSKERARQIFLKSCRIIRHYMLTTIKNYAVNKEENSEKHDLEEQINKEVLELRDRLEKLKIIRCEIARIEKELETIEPHASSLVMSIEDLNLSTRTYRCLKYNKIRTVYDLTQKTKSDLRKLRNLGVKSCREIERKLDELGLSLKGTY